MSDRASIFEGVQLGLEVTKGSMVPADIKLQGLSIEPGVKAEISTFRPMGTKFPTLAALGKEWTEAKLSGQLSFGEVIWPLAGVLGVVTGSSGSGGSYSWTFGPSGSSADNPATYTVEQGTADRAARFGYGLVNSLSLKFTRGEATLDGSMLGQALQDAIVMTSGSGVSSPEMVPVLPSQVSVYLADTAAGLTGASAQERALEVSWEMADRYGPLWVLDASEGSFVAHVETEPKLTVKLKMEADAAGMALLTTMRAGSTKFIRIEAVGAVIAGAVSYKLTIDTAVKISDVSDFSDADGVFAIEWTMAGMYDSSWGKATQVTVVNKVASL